MPSKVYPELPLLGVPSRNEAMLLPLRGSDCAVILLRPARVRAQAESGAEVLRDVLDVAHIRAGFDGMAAHVPIQTCGERRRYW